MSNQQVLLQLQRVRCVDESGGKYAERFGNDEMSLAALGVDAAGNSFLSSPASVGANFDDGETQHFPPRTLLTLDVPKDGAFPKECRAILMLAEIDEGGFNEIAQQAFAKLKEEMAKKKQEMAAGSNFAGPIVAAAIAVVVPLVVNYIKGKLAAGLSDDVFYPQDLTVKVASEDYRWGDGTKLSPEETVEFRAHDGVYKVTYYWEIRNAEIGREIPDIGRGAGGGILVNG